MVRVCGFSFLCASAFAARVRNVAVSEETSTDVLLNWDGANVTDSGSDCDSLWNPQLDTLFKNKRVWGSGATACVYGGVDQTGTLVAIKVGKPSENIAGWRSECAEQQILRLDACQLGAKTLALHEEFAPICTKVDQTPDKKTNYYVMHAGGTIAFRDLPKHTLSVEQKKNIFAQLVGAVYALHSADSSHNDLHGQNIVLDKQYKLALIDFGSLKVLNKAWKSGYKRDANAIWRWGSVLFSCGASADWVPDLPGKKVSKAERTSRAAKFRSCLSDLGADSKTIAAVKKMTDACVAETQEQFVQGLYESSFVQDNLKKSSKTHFPFEPSKGCLAWSEEKFQLEKYKFQFGSHYKCETTPNWIKTRIKKTAKGGTKKKQSKQCNSPDLKSACFSTDSGTSAACGGGLNMRLPCANLPVGVSGKYYSGACLKSNHPAYAVAQDWS